MNGPQQTPTPAPTPDSAFVPIDLEPPAPAAAEPQDAAAPAAGQAVSFRQLFRYADAKDAGLLLLGGLCAVAEGAGFPVVQYLLGKLINELQAPSPEAMDRIARLALYFVIVGAIEWALALVGMACYSVSGERQVGRMRSALFAAILNQEVAYFDSTKPGQLISRLTSDMEPVAKALGDSLWRVIYYVGMFVIAYALAFVISWRLALVMMPIVPVVLFNGLWVFWRLTEGFAASQQVYASAHAIAQEVFSSIRTVHAFDGIEWECARYNKQVALAQKYGIRNGLVFGLSFSGTSLLLMCAYVVCFIYGGYLVSLGINSAGDIFAAVTMLLTAGYQLSTVGPTFTGILQAQQCAFRVYEIIDRVPAMETRDTDARCPVSALQGHIEFRNVAFAYPGRPDVPMLHEFSVQIKAGQKVALVGPSGVGKSTVVALIERFYDPDTGEVLVDGVPLGQLNLHSWRQQVGLVMQEPVLFQASIMDNIRCANPAASDEDVVQACKEAFIHDVISQLPEGYATPVGEAGAQLSGGQRQQVALARALVKKPKVLLLDEATSALDRKSEMLVQRALKNAMAGRTVVTIAHRLVTVQDSDWIGYMQPRKAGAAPDSPEAKSQLLQTGPHSELMRSCPEYSAMVQAQAQAQEEGSPWDGDPEESLVREASGVSGHPPAEAEAVATVGSDDTKAKKEEEGKTKGAAQKSPMLRIARIRRMGRARGGGMPLLVCGVLAAVLDGLTWPATALLLVEVLQGFYESQGQRLEWKWSVILLGVGLWDFVWMACKVYCLHRDGEALTARLRTMLFRALVCQDMTFFDMPGNESGALGAMLASETSKIHVMWGNAIGSNVQAIVCLVASLVIAFLASWRLTLVALGSIPLMIVGAVFENIFLWRVSPAAGKALEHAGHVANESIVHHRTVFAFNLQRARAEQYDAILAGRERAALKRGVVSGGMYGFSRFTVFAVFALCFWYGSTLLTAGHETGKDVLQCTLAILLGVMGIGECFTFSGDIAGARKAAARMFEILDRVPAVDSVTGAGTKLAAVSGCGSFADVQFRYPSRPAVPVLRNLTFDFAAGQKLAILGRTGSGKSTIVALLMRYYDPCGGRVCVEGQPLPSLNVRGWRDHLGIVSQEPTLFDDTIANNIRYGRRSASEEEMHEAAKKANIHDFILSLPAGYETNVGPRGSQLSGGQKQRVALCRCIIRKPAILLLDEATSALDSVSEREVQSALDKVSASGSMTVVTVAHRLSTVTNCDQILLMEAGQVVEMGSHAQLYARQGKYWRLYNRYYGLREGV